MSLESSRQWSRYTIICSANFHQNCWRTKPCNWRNNALRVWSEFLLVSACRSRYCTVCCICVGRATSSSCIDAECFGCKNSAKFSFYTDELVAFVCSSWKTGKGKQCVCKLNKTISRRVHAWSVCELLKMSPESWKEDTVISFCRRIKEETITFGRGRGRAAQQMSPLWRRWAASWRSRRWERQGTK